MAHKLVSSVRYDVGVILISYVDGTQATIAVSKTVSMMMVKRFAGKE